MKVIHLSVKNNRAVAIGDFNTPNINLRIKNKWAEEGIFKVHPGQL